MRVITGSARGRKLQTLEGESVRPTTDMVKEAMFSIIHFDAPDAHVLDMFCGCGQLGIEALSRGAASATFVDMSSASVKIIKQNLEITGFDGCSKVYTSDYSSFTAMCRESFDIVFLDPPYKEGLLLPSIKAVLPLMSDFGTIVCEYPPEVEIPVSIGGFGIYRTYRYGKINVTFLRKGANL